MYAVNSISERRQIISTGQQNIPPSYELKHKSLG